jgi:hypothetical protein
MEARFRVDEKVGPFTVVSDTFTEGPPGSFVEIMKDSGGNQRVTFSQWQDTDYHPLSYRHMGQNLLIPFTVKHPATEAGVEGFNPTWINVSCTDYDYWRVLCDWWLLEDLTIIEHDVQASPEIFEELKSCPEPWCYFHYSNHTPENSEAWHYGILGCTRFRKELIEATPHAVTGLDERWRDWHEMSTGLGMALREAGFEPHVHGVVDHHRMLDVGGVVAAMAS